LASFQDPKVAEHLTDVVKQQLLSNDVTERLSKLLFSITERFTAQRSLEEKAARTAALAVAAEHEALLQRTFFDKILES
jgi:hypothetical protein